MCKYDECGKCENEELRTSFYAGRHAYELAVMLDYYNREFRPYSTGIKGKIKTD